jgi:hypothetical protein
VVTGSSDQVAAVRGYVAEVVGCGPDGIVGVSRFEQGDRHAVYDVAYLDAAGATEHVVARISFGNEPADRAQAEREARVLQQVGGVAAPILVDFRVTSAWF